MKRTLIISFFALMGFCLFAQNKVAAEELVNEGVPYHDKGDYDGAIVRYNKALELDSCNLMALAEKAYTLLSLGKYEESIVCSRKAIDKHPGEPELATVYVTYGTATDELKQTDKSIEIYDEGIIQFPNAYSLYFNKGITLMSVKRMEEAIPCFQKSAKLNPRHAGTQNAIARTLRKDINRIPSILAYSRFFVLESESERAKVNLQSLELLMNANVEKKGNKGVTVTVNPIILNDTTSTGKKDENSFGSTDLILSMTTALDFDKKYKKETSVDRFTRKFETLCASLSETKKDKTGFFWSYYVPYFLEMKDKNFIKTFAYITYKSSGDPNINAWLKTHNDEVKQFYDWSVNFKW